MIEQSAEVVALEQDYAWVETRRQSSCGSCAAKGCGTGALAQVLGGRPLRLRVRNAASAAVGDRVVLGLEESALVRGSVALYLVPLLALLGGALLGEGWAASIGLVPDLSALLFGAGGFALGMAWTRAFGRRAARDSRYQAVMLRREGGTGFVTLRPMP